MDQYPLYLPREKRFIYYALHLMVLVVSLVLFFLDVEKEGRFLYVSLSWYDLQLTFIPAIVIGGLFGNIMGMQYIFCTFVIFALVDPSKCYLPFIYMLVVILSDCLVRRGWVLKRWKYLLASLAIALTLGNGWNLSLILMRRWHELQVRPSEQLYLLEMTLPETLVALGIVALIVNLAPDRIRELFYNSHFYTEKYRTDYEKGDLNRRSRLAVRVAIVVIAVLFVVILLSMAQTALAYVALNQERDRQSGATEYAQSADYAEEFHSIRIERINVEDTIEEFLGKMLMSILSFTIPLMFFFNSYIQKSIVIPIRRISAFMKTFAKTTDDNRVQAAESFHKIVPPAHDEIRDLFFALDVVLEDMTDNIERLQVEKKLQEKLHYAEASNRAKNQFLSNVSHEIRTPINAVIGLDEMILRDTKEGMTAEYAREIHEAGRLLLSLINDLLDYSKIEAGRLEIIPVEYELSSVLMDLHSMIEGKARKKGLTLDGNISPTIPRVLIGDEIRLKQCILNITNNAIKYTDHGVVKLVVRSEKISDDEIMLYIEISDTGQGIRPEDMERLFHPFERIDELHNRSIEGTGLGLTIVKDLLEKMGSRLIVQSEYGKGSTFSFEVRQKVAHWEPIGDLNENYGIQQQVQQEYRETFHAPAARILAVDDTQMNLTVLQGLLRRTQVMIDTVTSGKEALEKVKMHRYDLIFMDHRMPEMDGIETLHEMRKMEHNENKDVPIVVLTANVFNTGREMYAAEGFDDYLAKPIDSVKLEELLIRLLPPEKVHTMNDDGTYDIPEEDNFVPVVVPDGIDYEAAVQACGGSQIFRQAAEEFLIDIEGRAARMEADLEKDDLNDYTIQVHALKSSARLIGATRLSERAAYLESCGKSEDRKEIEQFHAYMLDDYRSYADKIKMMLGVKPEDDKPLLTAEQLEYYMMGLKELVQAFDFDSLDIAIREMSDYRMPEDFKETFREIREAVMAVDREALLYVLSR